MNSHGWISPIEVHMKHLTWVVYFKLLIIVASQRYIRYSPQRKQELKQNGVKTQHEEPRSGTSPLGELDVIDGVGQLDALGLGQQ